ncbi:MAG: hypothetical protein WBD20_25690 [Pirellulaceae bacterium]
MSTFRPFSEGLTFENLRNDDNTILKVSASVDVFSAADLRPERSTGSQRHLKDAEIWDSLLAKIESFDEGDAADWSTGDGVSAEPNWRNGRVAKSIARSDSSDTFGFGWEQIGLERSGQPNPGSLLSSRAFRSAAAQRSTQSPGNQFALRGSGGGGFQRTSAFRSGVSPSSSGSLPSLSGGGSGSSVVRSATSPATPSTTPSSLASSRQSSTRTAAVSRVFDRVASSAPVVTSAPVSVAPSTPSTEQLADSGRPQLTADGKFGIPNHQYWKFSFTNSDGDSDGNINKADADYEFAEYLSQLDGLLKDAKQVVKFSTAELADTYADLNSQILDDHQVPQGDPAKSPGFLTFMIIDFPVKGFYLPDAEIPDIPFTPGTPLSSQVTTTPNLPAGARD